MPKFHEAVGSLIALAAVGVVAYIAIVQNNAQAQGALVAVVAAAQGYFLRAKVLPPNGTTAVPVTVTNPTTPALAPTVPPPAIPDPPPAAP